MIQNRTKRIRRNVINETAIQAENFIQSVYLLITIDTLLLRTGCLTLLEVGCAIHKSRMRKTSILFRFKCFISLKVV